MNENVAGHIMQPNYCRVSSFFIQFLLKEMLSHPQNKTVCVLSLCMSLTGLHQHSSIVSIAISTAVSTVKPHRAGGVRHMAVLLWIKWFIWFSILQDFSLKWVFNNVICLMGSWNHPNRLVKFQLEHLLLLFVSDLKLNVMWSLNISQKKHQHNSTSH